MKIRGNVPSVPGFPTQVTQGATTTESYSYDAVGNRLSSLGMSPYAYNSSNELTSTTSATFTYDGNDNTLTKADSSGSTTYGWDFESRLAFVAMPGSGGTVTFKYDPLGRRIQKSAPGGTTNYLYDGDGDKDSGEVDAGENVLARYTQTQMTDELLSELPSGTISYYLTDALDSVTSLSNPSGVLANTYTYDSFGRLAASTGTLTNPFQFTARDSDTETGLYYYRARYYDPAIGRFISEDPIGFDGGNVNFYAYVHDSPTNLVDPSGLQDNASPFGVGWEWLTGKGPRVHHFTDGDQFTELLRHHQHIQDLNNGVCNGTLPSNGPFNYDLSGVGGVPKYLKDYSTLATGGLTGNLAVTYLGSYNLTYSVTDGTLNIHAWNYSTINSATHPPYFGYKPWWNNNIGKPLNNFFSSGPMSQTEQIFDFHENLAGRDCGCKGAH